MNNKLKSKANYFIIIFLIIIVILETISIFNLNDNKEEKLNRKRPTKIVVKRMKEDFIKKNNIIFLGDSITERYPIDEIYDNYMVIKSGVGGYTTNDILEKMNNMVYIYNPTKIILLIGTNDIGKSSSTKNQETAVENIKKISILIRKNRPNAKLYIESIYPVNKELDSEMVNQRNNGTIKNMNKKIKEYCKENNITYIDMFGQLKDNDGNFNEKYTDDGLHPNTLGYAKITRILTPYVYE